MDQRRLFEILAESRGDASVVLGAGSSSSDFFAAVPSPMPALYEMELGYATAIALGLALGDAGHRSVAIEGDGSLLAGLPVLSTVGRYAPPNLVIVVPDNQSYAAIREPGYPPFPSATATNVDLEAVARGCGIAHSLTVGTEREARSAFSKGFSEEGPWFIVARIEVPTDASGADTETEPSDPRERGTGHMPDVFDNAVDFRRIIRERA